MTELAVVGDVHGDVARLRAMLRALEGFRGSMVFCGDYVNGGMDSAEVLETLSRLAEADPERYRFLCGNHDLAVLRYLDDGQFAPFAASGGLATLSSYLGTTTGDVHERFRAALPKRHETFLRRLDACWESDEVLVSHAGFDPERPEARDVETMAHAAGWPIFRSERAPQKLVVCGHYVQSRGPFVTPTLICVDTGCGIVPDAPLTAVILPERRLVAVG